MTTDLIMFCKQSVTPELSQSLNEIKNTHDGISELKSMERNRLTVLKISYFPEVLSSAKLILKLKAEGITGPISGL